MNEICRIGAIIINWNGAADSLDLLDSLALCQGDRIDLCVVIIDNYSIQSDFEQLSAGIMNRSTTLNVVLRRNFVNVGVPAAYNQGIQILGLDYDYYLRLDNDVTVSPSGLARLVDGLSENAERGVGIAGGNVKYFHSPEVDNGGATSIDLVRGLTTISYPAIDVICDGVLGCIMLISGDVVRKYAPDVFDPNLFICTDESELSLRAKKDGILTLYVSSPIGFHKGGVSTGKVKFLSSYYSARNWTIHRFGFVNGLVPRVVLFFRIIFDLLKSILKGRWAYPLGLFSGIAISVARAVDRKVRFGA